MPLFEISYSSNHFINTATLYERQGTRAGSLQANIATCKANFDNGSTTESDHFIFFLKSESGSGI